MYIRFAQTERDPIVRAAPGLFHAFHRLPPFDRDDWHHQEICRSYRWFGDHLTVPDVLSTRMSRFGDRQGICWFVDQADRCIDEARYLSWLLSEIGIPIHEVRSPTPGVEIWRDTDQIVAVPDTSTPVTIH